MKLREALQYHTHCVRCNQLLRLRGGLISRQPDIKLSSDKLAITYTIESYPLSFKATSVKAYFDIDLLTDQFTVVCQSMRTLHSKEKQCHLHCSCPSGCYSYHIMSDFNYTTNIIDNTQISLEQVILRGRDNDKWFITCQEDSWHIYHTEISTLLPKLELSLEAPDLLEQIKTIILFS